MCLDGSVHPMGYFYPSLILVAFWALQFLSFFLLVVVGVGVFPLVWRRSLHNALLCLSLFFLCFCTCFSISVGSIPKDLGKPSRYAFSSSMSVLGPVVLRALNLSFFVVVALYSALLFFFFLCMSLCPHFLGGLGRSVAPLLQCWT